MFSHSRGVIAEDVDCKSILWNGRVIVLALYNEILLDLLAISSCIKSNGTV